MVFNLVLTGFNWFSACSEELKAGDGYSRTAAEGFMDAYEGRTLEGKA